MRLKTLQNHRLKPMQTPYRHHKGAILGKAVLTHPKFLSHVQPFHPKLGTICLDAPHEQFRLYQIGANGSILARERHTTQPLF